MKECLTKWIPFQRLVMIYLIKLMYGGNFMKKTVIVFVLVVLIFNIVGCSSKLAEVEDGYTVINDTNYFPLVEFLEFADFEVNSKEDIITANNNIITIQVKINSLTIYFNGQKRVLDAPVINKDDIVYAPVSMIE